MKLKEFRIKNKKTVREMAKEFNVSRDVYASWEYHNRIPRVETMKMIVAHTNGAVTANDFYGINTGE